MNFAPITLDGFDERENALAQIKRYIHEITPIMFYRTNDLIHSRRVLWHLEESISDILFVYGKEFEVGFARTLALVHDDVEIITGDVQLYDKEHMNSAELEKIIQDEKNAIPRLVQMYQAIANGYDYGELLTSAKTKNRLEAQFVSFFDKFDGGGEAWHEVWAGNERFLRPAVNYVRRLNDFPSKYHAMIQFFKQFPGYLPQSFDFKSVAEKSKPHTVESLPEDSGYLLYERWKKTIMIREGVDSLVTQVEFS
jgi:5'-deoxynucleotidase YfbR-like HD superfamily hydrolase